MKKILSCFCALALIFSSGMCHYADSQASVFTTMSDFAQVSTDRITRYSTAEINNYNYADVTLDGNMLRVKRRANNIYTAPDQITIRSNGAAALEKKADWYPTPDDAMQGYDTEIDLSTLPDSGYTLEIKSRKDIYTYIVLYQGFQKDPAGCYFPKDTSVSKQYNYDTLRRLESGEVPDDFTALKELYGKEEANKQILGEIQAKAESLVSGLRTDKEKIFAVYQWMVENIAYDVDVSGDAYYHWIESHPDDSVRLDNPLNAFRQGYALCYGFARLTVLMMGYAGIDCVYVTGRLENEACGNINQEGITDPNKLNHAWNAVNLGGSWHFLDASLDAMKNYTRTDKERPETGSTTPDRTAMYLHQLPSLNYMSQRHIGLRLGVKNSGVKLQATSIPDGWQHSDGGSSSYYIDGIKIRNAWRQINGNIYYFNSTGSVLKGWQRVENYWRYFNDEGALLIGEQRISDAGAEQTYFFDSEGCLSADNAWVTFQGAARYYQGREMATGWKYAEGSWRYFDQKGMMYQDPKQPLTLSDGSFSFTDQGMLLVEGSGWLSFNGEKHYFDGNQVRTGPQQIDGSFYLFDATGVLQTGWQSYEGKTYYMNADGIMQTGWKFLDDNWYYLDAAGGMFTGVHAMGDASVNFDAQGRLSAGGWVDVGDGRLYFEKGKKQNGVLVGGSLMKGWRKVDDQLYFFDRLNGKTYAGAEPLLNENNKKWYTFDPSGVATQMQSS